MTVADLSIRNPVFAWMLMAFLVVFGGISLSRLGVSQMPDIDFPNVSVSVTLEGASPEIMETDVVDVIEDAVMSVEGVREVTATARQGAATINVEFDISRDIDVAVQDIQGKLAQAQRLLPREIDPPVVSKQNPEDNPIMWIALSGHLPMQDLALYARDHLKDKFQTVPGVGEAMMGGYLDRNLRIWLRLEDLEARELTVDDVLQALAREHIEVPAGRIETSERETNLRLVGEAAGVDGFRRLVIAYHGGAPVTLGDVAMVEDGVADRRRIARVMGVPAIGIGIKKQRGANAVEVAQGVRRKMEALRSELPGGLELGVNFDSTQYVEQSIHEIEFTLLLSVLLTSIVCWLFLGSWSSTFNILMSIPTSVVGTFIFVYFLGFTLNTFTLLSLSLAVGIVVDDAIMVLENIVRHRERGESSVLAASRGTREILFAALAATLSIMAIFLPIAFMKGVIGKFLYQFGVTISVAVALSLVEAVTLTPMRCSQMLHVGERASGFGRLLDRFFRGLGGGYGRLLVPALRFRWVVLFTALAMFGGSLWIGKGLRQEIVPVADQSILLVRAQTPVGSSAEYTEERLSGGERFIREHPDVSRYFSVIGGFGGGEVDTAIFFVTMKPPEARPEPMTQAEFQNRVRTAFNSIPGVRAFVNDLSMRGLTGSGSSFPVEFAVRGDDWDELARHTQEIMSRMKESGLLTDVNSNYLVGMPEVSIVPDRRRAADLGVSMEEIGRTVNAMIGGVRAGKFKDGGHRFDIRVRLVAGERSRPEDIRKLWVRNREGNPVRLSEVVSLEEKPTIQTITRRNRSRAITVTAGLVPGSSQKDALERVRTIAAAELPPGYGVEFTGSSKLFQEGGNAFGLALILGVAISYMILASQFNSYVHPVMVLIAMPFSLTGAFLAMKWADVSLNLYSMIGLVLLMGIVKKNSILLVDFTNQLRREGKGVRDALLGACPIRLRPILMTSVSTVAAAIPPALSLGPGAEAQRSMAIVVIGGVSLSTLLTLFVLPCAYSLVPGRVRAPEPVDPEDSPAPAELPAPSASPVPLPSPLLPR